MAEWIVRATHSFLFAVDRRSNTRSSRVFANSRLFLLFKISLDRADFCSCSRHCLQSAAPPLS